MEFFIKKNATLPVLKLQVVKDGRSDYDNFMKTIELSAIFFSMVDVESGVPKISSRPAGFVEKTFLDPNAEPEYYIYYQFQNRDTNKVGKYEGQFMLRNDDGVLILPIREKLFINIQESFIADDLPYESCYISEFPCCLPDGITTTTTTCYCPPCPSTTTTTTQPLIGDLYVNITEGSIDIEYDLVVNREFNEEISVDFTHILGVITGTPLNVTTGVTINIGDLEGKTKKVIDSNFNNLSKEDFFVNVVIYPPFLQLTIHPSYPTTTTTTTFEPVTTTTTFEPVTTTTTFEPVTTTTTTIPLY